MKLIIAEKPSLAMQISRALSCTQKNDGFFAGTEYYVTFAFGHLFTLKNVDDYLGEKLKWSEVNLPFIPEKYEFTLKDDDGIRKQYNIIKNLILQPEIAEIINCGDADREGQLIVDKIINTVFESANIQKPVKRLWLPEQTTEVIRDKVKSMKSNEDYQNLYNEGMARTLLDWSFGINLTRFVSTKAQSTYPCGRVLNPIVAVICERDLEIRNFKVEKYLQLESTQDGITFSIKKKYSVSEKESAENEANRLNAHKAIVKSMSKKELTKNPPKLFSLSTLQSTLSQDHNMDFATSAKVIQFLYENGLITYPRTSTEYLGDSEKDRIKSIISSLDISELLEVKDSKNIFDSSKVESHSAITITSKPKPNNLSVDEKTVYMAIYNRFVSNFLAEPCMVNQVQATVTIDDQEFILTGETIKQQGFMKYESRKLKAELPELEEGQELPVNFIVLERKTSKPKKITEASLSRYLKNPLRKKADQEDESQEDDHNDDEEYAAILKGIEIGTEATRTGIIENAIKYGYISRKGQNFSIEPKGENLISVINQLKIDLSAERTVSFSVLQKSIYKGEESIENVLGKLHAELGAIIESSQGIELQISKQEKTAIGTCPRCKKDVYESAKGFYCKGFTIRTDNVPECSFFLSKEHKFFTDRGKKVTLSIAKSLLSKGNVSVKGLKPKDPSKKPYDALVILEDTGKWINFKMEFSKK